MTPSNDSIDLIAARAELEGDRADVFDIREPHEHAHGVATGAVLLPMSQLGQRLGEIPTDASRPVLIICHTQNRSRMVVAALRDRGYLHARYVVGGMSMWAMQGWPMVKPD